MIDAMPGLPGRRIVEASWAGTIVFTVTAVLAAATLGSVRYVAVGVAFVLFGLGCVAFFWGYWLAVQRSRTDEIGIGGLFFLAGKDTAPARVKLLLLGSLGIQVVVAFVTAAARPYTTLAFGMLAPVFGLGCVGLWAARYGHFGPRVAPPPRRARRSTGKDVPAPPEDPPAASGPRPRTCRPTCRLTC